jgi:hypothetical protein
LFLVLFANQISGLAQHLEVDVATLKLDEPKYVTAQPPSARPGATGNPSVAKPSISHAAGADAGEIVVVPKETAVKLFKANELECLALIEEQVTM